jgi:hypothetical protein
MNAVMELHKEWLDEDQLANQLAGSSLGLDTLLARSVSFLCSEQHLPNYSFAV